MENKNQSAFAMCMVDGTSGATLIEYGLSKREYFAAMAMQGIIANAPNGHLSNSKEGIPLAIQWADELLKQLENGE